MAMLTPARLEILKDMAEGKVIREYTGQGRAGAHTELVDPPIWALHYWGDPPKKRERERAVKYSDFEALAFDLKYIIQYYTDYPNVYYMITP